MNNSTTNNTGSSKVVPAPAPAQIPRNKGSDVVKKTSELQVNTIEQNKQNSGKPIVMNNSTTNNTGSSKVVPGEFTSPLSARNDALDYVLYSDRMHSGT